MFVCNLETGLGLQMPGDQFKDKFNGLGHEASGLIKVAVTECSLFNVFHHFLINLHWPVLLVLYSKKCHREAENRRMMMMV